MGIRFHCEHCQNRLNVKATQAGQLGLCLHCRETIRVPLSSTTDAPQRRTAAATTTSRFMELAPGDDESSDERSAILDVDEQDTTEGLQAGQHSEPPPQVLSDPLKPSIVERPNAEPFELTRPSRSKTLGKVDPIEEAPKLVWHFRTKGFGERGPIKSKVMQRHLEEGNVGIGSMVWRQDWEGWEKAEDVFPELVKLNGENRKQARLKQAMDEAGYSNEQSITQPSARLQMLASSWLMTVVGLTIVAILCFVVTRLLQGS